MSSGVSDDDAALDRLLAIMWRGELGEPSGSRGPRARMSIDEVMNAAITVADRDGLAEFSMRRVADELGIGTMSLYTYVPGRSELIGLMTDRVLATTERPAHSADLRARLASVADAVVSDARAHPWLLDTESSRPLIGPGASELFEWQLSALEGIGLDDFEMEHTVSLLTGFASSAARRILELERTRSASSQTDAEWWQRNAPLLERLMPRERYPVSGRVGTTIGEVYQAASDPEASYRWGLDRILDGIERVASRRG